MSKKWLPLVFLLLTIALAIISVWYYYASDKDEPKSSVQTNSETNLMLENGNAVQLFISSNYLDKDVEVVKDYQINSELEKLISEMSFDIQKIELTIRQLDALSANDDLSHTVQGSDGQVRSGFLIRQATKSEVVAIEIRVNPDLEEKLLASEVNFNAILGILYAVRENSQDLLEKSNDDLIEMAAEMLEKDIVEDANPMIQVK